MTYVYVVGAKDGIAARTLPVKIGKSFNPIQRCRHLQAGCPIDLAVLGTWGFEFASMSDWAEVQCHNHFEKVHSHGEWFYTSVEDVAEFIESVKDDYRDGPRGKKRQAKYVFEGRRNIAPLFRHYVRAAQDAEVNNGEVLGPRGIIRSILDNPDAPINRGRTGR